MRSLLLLILLVKLSVAFAQEKPLVLAGQLPSPQMDIGPYTTFYKDVSGDTLPLERIRRQPFQPFSPKAKPYVENAIWRGLMHKSEGGTVRVEVTQPLDNLWHIEIEDDGVGRERAAELKSKSAGKRKSFVMQVTANRIRMINQLYNIQTQTQIPDLVDSFGEPCGTRVILEIPV
ncbi:hypothetical protein BH09BAC4_BH09BAC4_26940 [soil metagenome]